VFLGDKTYRLAPDVDYDRLLYQTMQDGDFEYWRNYKLEQLEDSGQQEVRSRRCTRLSNKQ
jgi:hypothetical protein